MSSQNTNHRRAHLKQILNEDRAEEFTKSLGIDINNWSHGDNALVELIILKQEQERTRQEEIKLQNVERSIQLLKTSVDAKIPGHMIPALFDKPVTPLDTPKSPYQFTVSTPSQSQPVLPSQPHALTLETPNKAPQFLRATRGHQRSSTISSTNDLHKNYVPSSPASVNVSLGSPKGTPDTSSISQQYITQSSPFKFPTKVHNVIPESQSVASFGNVPQHSPTKQKSALSPSKPASARPSIPTNRNNEPIEMSTFQSVIQFNHWQQEDPSAYIKKGNTPGAIGASFQKENIDQTHKRRKSNPDLFINRAGVKASDKVSKRPQSPPHTPVNQNQGTFNKMKRKIMSHTRTRSEIVQSKTIQDFTKFQIGKDNILNRDDTSKENKGYRNLDSLATAANNAMIEEQNNQSK